MELKRTQGIHVICLLLSMLFLLSMHKTALATPIILHGNQVITTPTTYNSVTLDLSDARFTVNTGGALTIQNSIINIAISPTNPYLALLNSGSLTLRDNTINVTVNGIAQTPNALALYQLLSIVQGNVNIINNTLMVNTPFTVSLLATKNSTTITNGLVISNNHITGFHGGLYLNNVNSAIVSDNFFSNVSFSNIYNSGNLSNISGNTFLFPGNLTLGNALDIVNSDGVTIANNIITSGSNYGISVTGANNLFIENNKISDSKLFGIIINTPTITEISKNQYLGKLLVNTKKRTFLSNNNIVISNNYIAQNRFGLTAGEVNTLIVTNNIFIQRFTDSSIRQQWTNNDILLPNVENLTWANNQYKEAFTQDNEGDNTPSLQFVNFPAHGGVLIN